MKELTEKVGTWDPQGCYPEGPRSTGLSKLLVICDKTKWMSYLLNENTEGTYCLVLQVPRENAQELKPDGFSYHRGLVIKEHLTPMCLMLLVCGSRNNPYTLVCRRVEMAVQSTACINYSFRLWLP